MKADKTLYLWDLAGTLFNEEWNKKLTGYPSFEAYAAAKGATMKTPRKFEKLFRVPYLKGQMFNLRVLPGYAKTLRFTSRNESFSTGVKRQMDWRARYLNPRVGYDIRRFFKKINSTFDFAESNVKTQAMLEAYFAKKFRRGIRTIVYSDDKFKNGKLFKKAARSFMRQKPEFNWRFYQCLHDGKGLRRRGWYWQAGALYDIVKNERSIKTKR